MDAPDNFKWIITFKFDYLFEQLQLANYDRCCCLHYLNLWMSFCSIIKINLLFDSSVWVLLVYLNFLPIHSFNRCNDQQVIINSVSYFWFYYFCMVLWTFQDFIWFAFSFFYKEKFCISANCVFSPNSRIALFLGNFCKGWQKVYFVRAALFSRLSKILWLQKFCVLFNFTFTNWFFAKFRWIFNYRTIFSSNWTAKLLLFHNNLPNNNIFRMMKWIG